jgi:uncharacterized protein YqgC (DUF456 family)
VGTAGELVVGLVLLAAVVGVVIPLLPGPLLAGAAIWVWALVERTGLAWTVAAVVTAVLLGSQVVKYLVPGRRMTSAGVPARTLLAGAALGLVGFFVVPVVGLPLGFVLGVYAAQRMRHDSSQAWRSTKAALRAVGLSILIELAAVLGSAGIWLAAVVVA